MARPLVVTQLLLEIEAKPGKERSARLVVTDEGVNVSGTGFRWSDVSRVRFLAIDQHMNGSYVHTRFHIGVGDAKRTAKFLMISSTTGMLKTQIDHASRSANHEKYSRAVDLIGQYAGARLVSEAVAAVLGGGTIEMSGVNLDPQGVHKRGLFGRKTIAWPDYAGVRREQANLYLLARDGDKTKSRIHLPNDTWNVALLQRALQELHTRNARPA